MAITYLKLPPISKQKTDNRPIQVKLDGKIVGLIRRVSGGFSYYPKDGGAKYRGGVFQNLDDCKKSLEEPTLPTPDCEHSAGEDCMNCTVCGKCRETLDEDEVCDECRKPVQPESAISCVNCGHSAEDHSEGDVIGGPCWNGSESGNRCACADYERRATRRTQPEVYTGPQGETEVTFIDITPEALKTPEGQAHAVQTQKEWDDATHEVANTLKRVIDDIFSRDLDKIARAELYSELQTLIGIRDVKQEAFIRAISGR